MARTAFEEALATGDMTKVPSYITAADTLNTANENESFIESALSAAESVPKFVAVSLISGANQLYNIPADIGNLLLDADIERSNAQDVITTLDSDLGAFYSDHKQGADLVGFMLSSVVPGLGGVKALNAGQAALRTSINAGKYGEGMGKALGLLAPMKKMHLDKALKEAMTGSSAVGITQGNALRAVTAGLGQNVLEAAAFETATALTLFNSPILENQDLGDFVSNVAWGAGVFGVIGGVVDGAIINSSIKAAKNTAAVEARPWTFINEPAAASSVYERLATRLDDYHSIPKVPDDLDDARQVFLTQAADTKREKLLNFVRKDLGELANGDQAVATALFNTFKTASREDSLSAFIGLEAATTMATTPAAAKRLTALESKMGRGKATAEEIEEYMESPLVTSYAKNWGENTGNVFTSAPVITQLADTLKKGQQIHVSKSVGAHGAGTVTAGKKTYHFNLNAVTGKKPEKAITWSPLKTNPLEANARYIWASKLPKFEATAKNPITIDVYDFPLMEKLLLEATDNPQMLEHVRFTGTKEGEFIGDNLHDVLGAAKIEVANRLLHTSSKQAEKIAAGAKGKSLTQEEIAAVTNIKSSMLDGIVTKDAVSEYSLKDIMAMQDHAEVYTKKLIDQGSRREKDGLVDIWNIPQHTKLTYTTEPFEGVNNFVSENMIIIKEQQKLYQEATSRSSALTLGEFYSQLPDMNSGRVYAGANPSGAGAGFATAASNNYGSLAAAMEQAGNVTSRAISAAKAKARESLEPLLYKVGTSDKAAIEWSTLNAKVRSIEGDYALNEAGDALEPLLLVRYRKDVAAAKAAGTEPPKAPNPESYSHMEPIIPIQNQSVRDLAKAHIEVNGKRTEDLATIRTAQGNQFNRPPEAFYPIPINPSDYPHFALVTDESITSGNHMRTLYASTEQELQAQITKLKQNPHLKIRTKKEAEEYYQSIGQWDYEKTINSNYLDTEAARKGVSAPYLVATDPKKITNDFLNWHMQRETGLVREAVSAKYEVQFNELRRLGDEATNIGTSKFDNSSLARFAEDAVANPYVDYIKTALAIRKNSDYPWWTNTNRMADEKFSAMFRKIDEAMDRVKIGDDVKEIDKILKQSGYKGAAYDPEMQIFANAEPARGLLTNTIQKANSLLATVILRWDPLNAVNNAVSANVLLGAETKAVMRAIERGDSEAIGALADLAKVKVPGTQQLILAPEKLIGNAIQKFGRDIPDFKFYKDNGFITSITDQYVSTLDDLAFTGAESIKSWSNRVDDVHKKLKAAGDAGERFTGNKLAEEFNRFVAADVMKQMTDVAVARKLMSEKEQLAYINTFVNRTQGNYLAAQRPMLFQGPIGQAIGLFQTYQFNLMQQLLRHVGTGRAKDTMTLLGLQGTIHGMNGLPAFNAINTHLVGNASGNVEHKDAYSTLYGEVGKEAGDWLMYGMASNALGLLDPALKVNLYTRGDINPRHVTIVPTNPADVPAYGAAVKVFSNIFETVNKLGKGGDVANILLQGIEHNGVSRPLAGFAQSLQAMTNSEQASYSTSNRGNVIAANDFLSLTNLARVVGGKPLDEAIAIDATYRYKAYALKDTKRRTALGEAIKSTMLGGEDPTVEQIEDFAESYAKAGGRQKEFAGWMSELYKTANLSQANKLQRSLTSPFAKSMQTIMGGEELRDFSRPVPDEE